MADITVDQVAYHRNGISGEPFYAVTFTDAEQGKMLAAVFMPEDEDRGRFHNPRIAVFSLDLLPDVTFGKNSWRGDNYAEALYEAIYKHDAEHWGLRAEGSA